jgi:hypothetical protein
MVNYYIFCHGCYIPFDGGYRNPNVNLWFDTELNNESCSTELNLNFDESAYKYKENFMNPQYDYILSFKDANYSSADTTLKMFGLFDENQNRVEIKNITNGSYKNVRLTVLLDFLLRKNERSNIYCSFCRNKCDNSTNANKDDQLELGSDIDNNINDYDDIQDFKAAKFDDDDINYDIFGGKRKRRLTKKTYRKRGVKKISKKYLKKRKNKTYRRNK